MSGYQDLTDEQWGRLKPYLPYGSTGKPGRNANNRLFIDALLWMARSGVLTVSNGVIISGLRPGF